MQLNSMVRSSLSNERHIQRAPLGHAYYVVVGQMIQLGLLLIGLNHVRVIGTGPIRILIRFQLSVIRAQI